MGCIISYCKDDNEEYERGILISSPSCFVCGKSFKNIDEYKEHIIHCNKLYKTSFKGILK